MGSTFSGVTAFAFMACMLLIGTVLRARIGIFRNALLPASLIGGSVGFALVSMDWSLGYQSGDFTAFTFHFFTLSFMSLVLTGREKSASRTSIVPGGSWLSVVWVMSLVLQALVGLAVIVGYNSVSEQPISEYLGMLVTHGFTQGPGQALALGAIWESELGIDHAISFGLIYASMGFIAAFAIGIPVARHAIRHGLNSNPSARIDDEFLSGILARDSQVSAGRQVTHSGNVDTLAFHLSILAVAYVLTDQYLKFMQPMAAEVTLAGVNFGLIFSHNLFFFHGLMITVALRALIDAFGFGHYIDNETQKRITGSSVDLMVVATLMSIEFAMLATYFVPIALVCVTVAACTALLCFGLGRRLGALGVERAVTIFGCCCGSTGSGLLLLRILDPTLSTPIAKELAFFNIAILVLSFHVLMLMAPILPSFSLGTIVIVYSITFVVGAAAAMYLGGRMSQPLPKEAPEPA
jgi:ESS family glutamate:Na+ symporter